MTFTESVKTCFSKFATFEGRASRSEFWWFYLLNFLLGMVPGINSISGLVLLIPSLAVGCRRLHDRGMSGWWQALPYGLSLGGVLLMLSFSHAEGLAWGIPLLGVALAAASLLWLLVQFALPGMKGVNTYGADPVNPMICPSCGAPCGEQDSFCPQCGGTLENASWQPGPGRCPQCGTSCPADAAYCPHCGALLGMKRHV